MTTDDEATNEIPELIESLGPILTVPDPAMIRNEAGRRRTLRHRVGALGVVAVVVATLGALTAFGGDDPTETVTVATDSPPRIPVDDAGSRMDLAGMTTALLETEWLVATSENPTGVRSWRVLFSEDTISIGTGCSLVVHEIEWKDIGFTTGTRLPDVDTFTGEFGNDLFPDALTTCPYSPDTVDLVATGDPVEVFQGAATDRAELRGTGETNWTLVLVPDPDAWGADDEAVDPLKGNSYGVRWTENAPAGLQPWVGYLRFDEGMRRLEYTNGCEGASYQVTAVSGGFVIDRVNPEPVVAANVSCFGDASLLSLFSKGDVVRIVPSLLDDTFDLFVEGETEWSMRIDGTDWPWSADRFQGSVGIVFTVLAENVEGGGSYSVELIENAARFNELGLLDGVDFGSHVVFVFDLAESSSLGCEFQPMRELVFDAAEERLYPLVLMRDQIEVGEALRCRSDAGPHRIIVSVAKRDLPGTGFTVWINAGEPPALVNDALLEIEAGRFRN